MLCIGIDPPKGIAGWETETKKFTRIETVSFWDIIGKLKEYKFWNYNIKVYCEAPQLIKGIYRKRLKPGEKLEKVLWKAQSVGMNKMCAVLIIEYCELNNIEVVKVRPSKKTMSKLKSEPFKQLTGWTNQTSEHGRDAAMLVYGL